MRDYEFDIEPRLVRAVCHHPEGEMSELTEYQRREVDNPHWHLAGRIHDWRNHVPEDVQAMWSTFSQAQRYALYAWAEELADREHWD